VTAFAGEMSVSEAAPVSGESKYLVLIVAGPSTVIEPA